MPPMAVIETSMPNRKNKLVEKMIFFVLPEVPIVPVYAVRMPITEILQAHKKTLAIPRKKTAAIVIIFVLSLFKTS